MLMVHRYWSGERSSLNEWTRRTLVSLGHKVQSWDDKNVPQIILNLADDSAECLPASEHIRHRSNVVRWWALSKYGGWWADHDLIPLMSFTSLPSPASAAHNGMRCTCWLAFPANHEVPQTMLEVVKNVTGNHESSSTVSGERAFNEVCPEGIAAMELAIDPVGVRRNTLPWGIHLYSHSKG